MLLPRIAGRHGRSPALLGWVFERVIVRPVYGQHLKQILVTMGGLIVAEQLIHVFWGAGPIPLPLPAALPRRVRCSATSAIERYRLIAVAVGLVVFVAHAAGPQPHQASAC